jgi:hypothetical protein
MPAVRRDAASLPGDPTASIKPAARYTQPRMALVGRGLIRQFPEEPLKAVAAAL